MLFNSIRNVGISSTTPYAKLSVINTGSGPSFVVEDDTSPDSTPFIVTAAGDVGIGTTSPTQLLSVSSSGGNSAYFAGNVGIGTTSPGVKLDVAGTAAFDYLRLDATNGTDEGGEMQFIGAGSNHE